MDDYNEIETMKLYASKLRDLLIDTYQTAYSMYVRVPLAHKTVEEVQHMTDLFNEAYELGIEIDL